MTVLNDDWRTLHARLNGCDWFARVGETTARDGEPSLRRANSWSEAARWTSADISWWCSNEASNVLRQHLHIYHNKEYQEWNNHIDSFASSLDNLMNGPVAEAIPAQFHRVDVLDWVRYSIKGAFLECIYASRSDVRLACKQVEWYLAGHFPCGWTVDKEEGFPEQAVTILF